jgi:hypothetical protein
VNAIRHHAAAAVAIIGLLGASPGIAAGHTFIDLSEAQVEILNSTTLKIRQATVAGRPGKYWADVQWNPATSIFVPIASGEEASPSFYDKTLLLKGTWRFVYTIASTFTDDYTLSSIPGTTNSQGGYFIYGTNRFDGPVVAAYWPTDGNWSLLDSRIVVDRFYEFHTDGNVIQPNSCYYQISFVGISNCFALSGSKTATAAVGHADPDAALAGDTAREREARAHAPAEAMPARMSTMEKYWIMKGLLGR